VTARPARGRALAFAALAALASACSAQQITVGGDPGSGGSGIANGSGAAATGGGVGTFAARDVDMLFVIDDSSFMTQLQRAFLANFPTLMTRLKDPPGLPNLHIAVVSTDMGAGDGSISGCSATGKNGAFQYAGGHVVWPSTPPCATGLDPGATFLSDVGGMRNYTGPLEDAFTCMAALGETGCGFQHQLTAITRALGADGMPPPPENRGFLRPDAYLYIVIVTNEDDCSAPPGSSLFDDNAGTSIDSPFGLLSNYRCNEFGHLCNGARPPRLPPGGNVNEVVTLDGCASAEGDGMLTRVSDVVAQLRSLKANPDKQIFVAAIAGPATPYAVRWQVRMGETVPRAQAAPSCTSSDGSTAAPAVRIEKWVRAFGDNGVVLSACDSSYAAVLDRFAARMGLVSGPDYPL
jgi:hypothetical protein